MKGEPKIGMKVRLGTVVWIEPEEQRSDEHDPHVDIKPKDGGPFIRRIWSEIKPVVEWAPLPEKSPPGWKGTVKAMKRDQASGKMPRGLNPFALAWSMHKKGAKPHYSNRAPFKKKDEDLADLVAVEAAYGPTRMQVQQAFDQERSVGKSVAQAIAAAQKALGVKDVRVNSQGTVVFFDLAEDSFWDFHNADGSHDHVPDRARRHPHALKAYLNGRLNGLYTEATGSEHKGKDIDALRDEWLGKGYGVLVLDRASQPSKWRYSLSNPQGGSSSSTSETGNAEALARSLLRRTDPKYAGEKWFVIVGQYGKGKDPYKVARAWLSNLSGDVIDEARKLPAWHFWPKGTVNSESNQERFILYAKTKAAAIKMAEERPGFSMENFHVMSFDVTEGQPSEIRTRLVALFSSSPGVSYTAPAAAKEIGATDTEVRPELARMVNAGMLRFEKGEGYSLNTIGKAGSLRIPSDVRATPGLTSLDFRRGSRPTTLRAPKRYECLALFGDGQVLSVEAVAEGLGCTRADALLVLGPLTTEGALRFVAGCGYACDDLDAAIALVSPVDEAVKLRLKKIDDEWVVQWVENGKVNDEKSYYTDDKDDAVGTMKAMQAQIDSAEESLGEGYQHVHWKGATSLRFKITTASGQKTVQGRSFGKYIGIHADNKAHYKDAWVVTHMPTGLRLGAVSDDRKAVQVAKSLEAQLGDALNFTDPASVPEEVKKAITDARARLRNESVEEAGLPDGFLFVHSYRLGPHSIKIMRAVGSGFSGGYAYMVDDGVPVTGLKSKKAAMKAAEASADGTPGPSPRGEAVEEDGFAAPRKKFGLWTVRRVKGAVFVDDEKLKRSYDVTVKHGDYMLHPEGGGEGISFEDADVPADVLAYAKKLMPSDVGEAAAPEIGKNDAGFYVVRSSGLKDTFKTLEKLRYALSQMLGSMQKASAAIRQAGLSESKKNEAVEEWDTVDGWRVAHDGNSVLLFDPEGTEWEVDEMTASPDGEDVHLLAYNVSEDGDEDETISHQDVPQAVRIALRDMAEELVVNAEPEPEESTVSEMSATPPMAIRALEKLIATYEQRAADEPDSVAADDLKDYKRLLALLKSKSWKAAHKLVNDMDTAARDALPDAVFFLPELGFEESVTEARKAKGKGGYWRTTKGGHKIYIEGGKITKGNPHVVGKSQPAAKDPEHEKLDAALKGAEGLSDDDRSSVEFFADAFKSGDKKRIASAMRSMGSIARDVVPGSVWRKAGGISHKKESVGEAETLRVGSVRTFKGKKVRVISLDSDPRADVWVVYIDDPDKDAMVSRKDLKEEAPLDVDAFLDEQPNAGLALIALADATTSGNTGGFARGGPGGGQPLCSPFNLKGEGKKPRNLGRTGAIKDVQAERVDEMAKLSARGRKEILRLSKQTPPPADSTDRIEWYRHTRAYMSDGSVLTKMDARYLPDPKGYGRSLKGYVHTWGWKNAGKLKKELMSVDGMTKLRDQKVADGWTVEEDNIADLSSLAHSKDWQVGESVAPFPVWVNPTDPEGDAFGAQLLALAASRNTGPKSTLVCPSCEGERAYWHEAHPDTGMDEFVVRCPDCKVDTEGDPTPVSLLGEAKIRIPHWRTLVDELMDMASEIKPGEGEVEIMLHADSKGWNLYHRGAEPKGKLGLWAEGTIDAGLTMDDARETAQDMVDQLRRISRYVDVQAEGKEPSGNAAVVLLRLRGHGVSPRVEQLVRKHSGRMGAGENYVLPVHFDKDDDRAAFLKSIKRQNQEESLDEAQVRVELKSDDKAVRRKVLALAPTGSTARFFSAFSWTDPAAGGLGATKTPPHMVVTLAGDAADAREFLTAAKKLDGVVRVGPPDKGREWDVDEVALDERTYRVTNKLPDGTYSSEFDATGSAAAKAGVKAALAKQPKVGKVKVEVWSDVEDDETGKPRGWMRVLSLEPNESVEEAVDVVAARQYVKRIKNEKKRAYAEAWLAHLLGKGPKPDSSASETGLSYMAAQAVRMELDKLLTGEDMPTDVTIGEAMLEPLKPATVTAGPNAFVITFREAAFLASPRHYWTGSEWSAEDDEKKTYGTRKDANADLPRAKKAAVPYIEALSLSNESELPDLPDDEEDIECVVEGLPKGVAVEKQPVRGKESFWTVSQNGIVVGFVRRVKGDRSSVFPHQAFRYNKPQGVTAGGEWQPVDTDDVTKLGSTYRGGLDAAAKAVVSNAPLPTDTPESVDESLVVLGGLAIAALVGAPLAKGVIAAVRAVKALLDAGKKTAAEKTWDKISKGDRAKVVAWAKKQKARTSEVDLRIPAARVEEFLAEARRLDVPEDVPATFSPEGDLLVTLGADQATAVSGALELAGV